MNTNETKAKIWAICVEKGLFNTIKSENLSQIQGMFETIIKNYEKFPPSQNIFDKVIDSLSIEIQKTYASYEEKQKEYETLLVNPVPKTINFADNKDEHLENLVQIVEEKQKERQMIFEYNTKPQMNLEDVLTKQNNILIKILESQMKILDLLKK
uniref:Uncharacterized protein n=1 Tax=viral metagenome TaxID=1070528 RepID=A0A6C0ETT4_9ZZZZ